MTARIGILAGLGLACLGLLAGLAGAAPARAAGTTITVSTTLDALSGDDGLCSLREAVIAANTDTASGPALGECPAGSGPDTITFAAAVSGSLSIGPVNPALPPITDSVAIQGPGADLLQLYRPTTGYGLAFNGSGRTFTVSGLTVTGLGAASGGVMATAGALTLDSVRLAYNAGMGGLVVNNAAVVTVTNSQILNNHASAGGGLNNAFGQVLVINSVISGNGVGFYGGGVYNLGRLEIVGSLVAFNGIGGGNGDSQGAGIYNSSNAVLTLTNSTLSHNLAVDPNGSGYGGGLFSSGQATLSNVTLTDNAADGAGAGLRVAGGTTTLRHTVIANSQLQGDCSLGAGVLTLSSVNLIEDNSCGFAGGSDPVLGPLQDNGGSTLTHALLPGSPAIDAGDPAGCQGPAGTPLTIDQRGFVRPVDGDSNGSVLCDIGAYEYGAAAPTPPPPATATATSVPTATPSVPVTGPAYNLYLPALQR